MAAPLKTTLDTKIETLPSSRTRADYVLFHNTNVPFAYACAGDKFVEYNLKTRQQRTISLTAFPSPA